MEAAAGGGRGGERQQALAEGQPRAGRAQRAGVGGQGQQAAARAGRPVGPPEHVAQVLLAVDDRHLPGPRSAVGGQRGEGVQCVAAAAGGAGGPGDAARFDGGQQPGRRAVADDLGAVPEELLGGSAPLGDPARPVDQHEGEPYQGDHA